MALHAAVGVIGDAFFLVLAIHLAAIVAVKTGVRGAVRRVAGGAVSARTAVPDGESMPIYADIPPVVRVMAL
jgi:hypothetical protein